MLFVKNKFNLKLISFVLVINLVKGHLKQLNESYFWYLRPSSKKQASKRPSGSVLHDYISLQHALHYDVTLWIILDNDPPTLFAILPYILKYVLGMGSPVAWTGWLMTEISITIPTPCGVLS